MSQQSNSSSSKNMSGSSSAEPSNPNREDPVADSANTPHARRPKETVSGLSSAIALEERTKEGSRYVHNAIATMVIGILSGNHKESNVDKPLDNVAGEEVHVTHDVSDNPNCEAETVDLEEFSDNELLSSVLPSIAKRVRSRREKKTMAQRFPRKKIDVPTSSKTTVAVESFLKRKVHGPTKSWSKGVPKKKKTKHVVIESDSDVPCNVFDTLSKKKPTTSKIAASVSEEFIVNLSEEYVDGKSKEFRKVYVRGKCVNFSPSVINKYLGRPDVAQPELEIGATNWVPTNHKSTVAVMLGMFIYAVGTKANFDYGSYIFDQTLKHAGRFSVKGPIAFPFLICGIVLNQFPNILTENDSVKKRDSPMSFNHQLFLGTHVPDIIMTIGETSRVSNQPSKAAIIAMLKETCREL
ncbi:uncharacterized protein LOC127137631 [Lathyrus oleraceus]|uniref:uncharacterized protein LOC127137631 n=1 Tax=Pisum sativum TaxID=3888 RepID=UPI0021CF533B|nr:uncharacterized protein LOC127137631 [Pisum sativum]